MFCLDCHHRLTAQVIDNRLVHTSTLTQESVCERTGGEHRSGDSIAYANWVGDVFPRVLEMVERGDIEPEVGLHVLAIDLGFRKRGEASEWVRELVDLYDKGKLSENALRAAIDDLAEVP